MNTMLKPKLACLAALLLLAGCSQVSYQLAPRPWTVPSITQDPEGVRNESPEEQEPDNQEPRRRSRRTRHIDDVDVARDRPYRTYSQTRVRLQAIRENIELDDLDVDFDSAPNGSIFETERDRTGFRAELGSNGGGFVQIFREKLRAPALLTEEFVNHGIGGGAFGTPRVGTVREMELIVPWRVEVNLVGGSERVGGSDQDLFYAESNFELGFGARAFNVQASSGLIANSIGGIFNTDLPGKGDADISGTNVGVYFEVLYKHPRVPLMARARAIAGDVQGVMLSFGFAF